MGPKLGHLRQLYADVFMPVCEIFTTRIGIAVDYWQKFDNSGPVPVLMDEGANNR